MINVEAQHISGIPLLHIVRNELASEKTPLVIFIHGFMSAKENNLHYAYLLAEKGMRVVLPEAAYHGERNTGYSNHELSMKFWQIIINEIHELKIVKDHYEQLELVDPNRIGVAGTSMGGITTFGALTQYDWIKAAVSLMGNPKYSTYLEAQIKELRNKGIEIPLTDQELKEQMNILQKYDLSMQKDVLNGRPLLIWHGMKDNVVPFVQTYDFYKEIMPMYEHTPEKLCFIADKKADHKVSREGIHATVDWFTKNL
ncbi:prolyl oligopeptidase family serine peptidase [Metabacillus fastidiosus]|uniref:prolyl oligopeptidase family serine peptidase n=1 Tax=Metabacillus fastidiosus TaxID=1458 RepID=UPI003D2A933D